MRSEGMGGRGSRAILSIFEGCSLGLARAWFQSNSIYLRGVQFGTSEGVLVSEGYKGRKLKVSKKIKVTMFQPYTAVYTSIHEVNACCRVKLRE